MFPGLISDFIGTSFNVSRSGSAPIEVDKSFTLFNQSVSCPGTGKLPAFTGEVKVDVEAKLNASVQYGLTAVGTVVPPALTEFALFSNFDAVLNGILSVDATASVCIKIPRPYISHVTLSGHVRHRHNTGVPSGTAWFGLSRV